MCKNPVFGLFSVESKMVRADGAQDAGEGLQGVLDVGGGVLPAYGEAEAACGPFVAEADGLEGVGGFGVSGGAGGAAAGANAGNIQMQQQIIPRDVAKGKTGVMGQAACGMPRQAAVVRQRRQYAANQPVSQRLAMRRVLLAPRHRQAQRLRRAHGKGDVHRARAPSLFLPPTREGGDQRYPLAGVEDAHAFGAIELVRGQAEEVDGHGG